MCGLFGWPDEIRVIRVAYRVDDQLINDLRRRRELGTAMWASGNKTPDCDSWRGVLSPSPGEVCAAASEVRQIVFPKISEYFRGLPVLKLFSAEGWWGIDVKIPSSARSEKHAPLYK
jgi:hypothetical protein